MYHFKKSFNKTIKITLTNATEILTCEIIKSPYEIIDLPELFELIDNYEVKPDYIIFTISIQLKQVKTLKFSAIYKKEEKKIVLDFFNPTYLKNEIVLIFDKNYFTISRKISQVDRVLAFEDGWGDTLRVVNIDKMNDVIRQEGSVFPLSYFEIFANYLLCDIISNNNFEINGVKINKFMSPVQRVLKGNFVEIKFIGPIGSYNNEKIIIRIYGYY